MSDALNPPTATSVPSGATWDEELAQIAHDLGELVGTVAQERRAEAVAARRAQLVAREAQLERLFATLASVVAGDVLALPQQREVVAQARAWLAAAERRFVDGTRVGVRAFWVRVLGKRLAARMTSETPARGDDPPDLADVLALTLRQGALGRAERTLAHDLARASAMRTALVTRYAGLGVAAANRVAVTSLQGTGPSGPDAASAQLAALGATFKEHAAELIDAPASRRFRAASARWSRRRGEALALARDLATQSAEGRTGELAAKLRHALTRLEEVEADAKAAHATLAAVPLPLMEAHGASLSTSAAPARL